MRVWIAFGLVLASLALAGCKSPATQTTFQRPYPEVRAAIQTLCNRLEFPSERSREIWGEIQLTLGPEPLCLSAWVSSTNEVAGQSYSVVVWDQIASFPSAPHMQIRAVRLSPETTRVVVLSEAPSQSSVLITKRRTQHEKETLGRLSGILAGQWLSKPKPHPMLKHWAISRMSLRDRGALQIPSERSPSDRKI